MSADTPSEPEKGKQPNKQGSDRKSLVEAVTSPLNFFALMVVVCEGIFGLTCVKSKLSENHQFIILTGMLILLGASIAAVTVLTAVRPRHLSPEMARALEAKAEEAQELITILNRPPLLSPAITAMTPEDVQELIFNKGFQTIIQQQVDKRLAEWNLTRADAGMEDKGQAASEYLKE